MHKLPKLPILLPGLRIEHPYVFGIPITCIPYAKLLPFRDLNSEIGHDCPDSFNHDHGSFTFGLSEMWQNSLRCEPCHSHPPFQRWNTFRLRPWGCFELECDLCKQARNFLYCTWFRSVPTAFKDKHRPLRTYFADCHCKYCRSADVKDSRIGCLATASDT